MDAFRKKPVVIAAAQFDPDKRPDLWPSGVMVDDASPTGYSVSTLEPNAAAGWNGQAVTAGDWIIRGVKGELYPCKPDVFAETYEAVDQAPSSAPRALPPNSACVPAETMVHIAGFPFVLREDALVDGLQANLNEALEAQATRI